MRGLGSSIWYLLKPGITRRAQATGIQLNALLPIPRKRGADSGDQLGEAEGLNEVVVGTSFDAGGDVALVAARGEHKHGDRCGCGVSFEPLEHLEAIQHWDHHVE